MASWNAHNPGPLGDSLDRDSIPQVIAEQLGDSLNDAITAWNLLDPFCMSALTLLQRAKAARQDARAQPEFVADTRELNRLLSGWLDSAADNASDGLLRRHARTRFLRDLLRVLDDEELIVLYRPRRRGYVVRISGLGDNFQLHTLLAAALIGNEADGFIAGHPPRPEWVSAASNGPVPQSGAVEGYFNLVDAKGEWIWNEGVPDDIPAVEGRRVVVLDPPPYARSWSNSRLFPFMPGEVELLRQLSEREAEEWFARVSPARPLGRG